MYISQNVLRISFSQTFVLLHLLAFDVAPRRHQNTQTQHSRRLSPIRLGTVLVLYAMSTGPGRVGKEGRSSDVQLGR
jgi:hypothetical protein